MLGNLFTHSLALLVHKLSLTLLTLALDPWYVIYYYILRVPKTVIYIRLQITDGKMSLHIDNKA